MHAIWGFVVNVLTPVYDVMLVMNIVPLVPDVGTQKPGYVSPLATSQGKSVMLETGYIEVDIENAMSITCPLMVMIS